jgi:hypothetical protein
MVSFAFLLCEQRSLACVVGLLYKSCTLQCSLWNTEDEDLTVKIYKQMYVDSLA